MKVLVIGSGLIGVTAAYFLHRRGHDVTVLERQEGAGQETSFANGALLTPSMSDPWNSPGCWRVLLSSLGRSDASMQLRLRALPSSAKWGVSFLRNSRHTPFEKSALSNLRLALHSLKAMEDLRQQTGIEYGRAARGSLRLFRDEDSLERACRAAARLVAEGLGHRRLSVSETIGFEPSLQLIADRLAGAIRYSNDEIGDAHQFCVALAAHARRVGVEFRFSTEVSSVEIRSGKVTAVLGQRERFVADRYVIAAGSYSLPLLKQAGVHVPIRPAKGYSLTFDDHTTQPSLNLPVLDDHLHAVVVPLQGAIRVAGTAEFAGFDRTIHPGRIRNLESLVQAVLPHAQLDRATARPWCGLRPMSVDGVPIIGTTPISNLLVSTGHGHLGWTMAAGSGHLLADLLSGNSTAIDPAPFALARFT
jgi:D-amino-acid dehydrogenase